MQSNTVRIRPPDECTSPGTGAASGLEAILSKLPRGAVERSTPPVSAGEPLLVSAKEAARMCGVSPATWARRASAGQTLPAIKWGGHVLYRVDLLREWVGLGMPDRHTWETIKKARK
jgi:hypothetical protein